MVSADGTPKVFVTYAHDSPEHKDDVRTFATLLQRSGIDTELDQWISGVRQDWSAWAINGMTSADYVVVVVSPNYKVAGDGFGPAKASPGVQSEAAVLRDLLHSDRATWLPKLLPVVLPGHEIDEIPYFLQPYTADHYVVEEIDKSGIEELVRVITYQPSRVRPPLGVLPVLPPLPDGAIDAAVQLSQPPAMSWRGDLSGRSQTPTLEMHLIPVGNHARMPVRRLAPLADELAAHGRSHNLFEVAEPLTVDSSDQGAWALAANTFRRSSGIAVQRTGQRSAWSALPQGRVTVLLIPDDVVERLADLMTALLALDLPRPERLAAAVGLEPLNSVSIGTRADLTASSGRLHMHYPEHIRIPAEEAFTVDHLRATVDDVAEELAARLIAAFRRECR